MQHYSIAELYDTHAAAIQRYIQRRISDRPAAEDLTNDVFVRVIEGMPRYEDRGLPIEAWLYRIAHDRVIDYYRRTARFPTVSIDGDNDDVELAQPNPSAADSDTVFAEMLARLTDEQRAVLLLRYRDDLAYADIAQHLQRSEGSVKQLQKRAIRQLKTVYRPTLSA
jgi:RNA polymerase sigma-70 factor, ECF subfamily